MPNSAPIAMTGPWYEDVTQELLNWFSANARDLPWRYHYTPYEIWVSEIMLQQTQMLRVVGYFRHFMSRFPTLQALAHANLEEVLSAWEGLGYYRRAKSLHETARLVMTQYGGVLPSDQEKLEALPGIGHYTAAAIAAIAFEQPTVGVDANVVRVLTRLFDYPEDVRSVTGKTCIERFARTLLPRGQARAFNQALMELGALICGRKPLCTDCPWQKRCLAHAHGSESQRPVQPSPAQRQLRSVTAGLIVDSQRRLVLCQRPNHGIWANLWALPEFTLQSNADPVAYFSTCFARQTGLSVKALHWHTELRHAYTIWQILLQARAYCLESVDLPKPFAWFAACDVAHVPVPSPHRTLLERFFDRKAGRN